MKGRGNFWIVFPRAGPVSVEACRLSLQPVKSKQTARDNVDHFLAQNKEPTNYCFYVHRYTQLE